MKLDGRILQPSELRGHLASLQWAPGFRPKFPVLHNTSVPDGLTYKGWIAAGKPTMEQWLRNLASYYDGLGWASMPHAFVLPDGRIGLGAPFNVRGTHSPSWNSVSIGVETVGDFDRERWAGSAIEMASVALFGELCRRLSWTPDMYARGVRGIHFHKEDPTTDHKGCPGSNVDKPRFVARVLAYMGDANAADEGDRAGHVEIPAHVQAADTSALSATELLTVVWVQQRLVAKGYKVAVNGRIGADTKGALLAFQQAHPPLKPDGVAGPLTRLALSQ